jgi:DNA-binding beta-propeller fold protein YncE
MRKMHSLTILAVVGTIALHGQWVKQKSGTGATLAGIVTLDSMTAIAAGRDGSILRTTDAGNTWISLPLLPLFFHPWIDISFFNQTTGCVVADNGHVATTTDGGKNWAWRVTPGGRTCLSALFTGPANIYVGADSGWIYHSQDTGSTWFSEKISAWPIRSLFAWRGPYVWGLPVYALTPYSLCAKVEFPPGPWSEAILPAFSGLGSEAYRGEFSDGGGPGFIVGVHGDLRAAPAIVRKSMSDTAWRTLSTGLPGDGTLFGLSAPSANAIYVCGDHGMIFCSTNGGDTRSAPSVPTAQRLRAITFLDEKRGFAAGDSGIILYTSNGGVTSADGREDQLPTKCLLYQNYPNPFNPSTTIRYGLTTRSHVSLMVYNTLGQLVSQLVHGEQEAGYHEVRFDASGLSSEVYFYRLRASDFVQTRMLLLLR